MLSKIMDWNARADHIRLDHSSSISQAGTNKMPLKHLTEIEWIITFKSILKLCSKFQLNYVLVIMEKYEIHNFLRFSSSENAILTIAPSIG